MADPSSPCYGFSAKEIARTCKVDLSTARRWKREATCLPETARMILERDLGCFHPDWCGWTVNARGELVSPENWRASPGEVLSLQFVQAQLAVYRLENHTLRADLTALEESLEPQPLPGSVPDVISA